MIKIKGHMKTAVTVLFAVSLLFLSSCSKDKAASSAGGKDGTTSLTLLGWEIYQKAGMVALADKYEETHPNVDITVDISTWGEYWTKLEAMANTNSLPDIFWMHTNEFSRYAEAGLLADLTDLYADVEDNYYYKHFPDNLVLNATYEGRIYGVPKDWDTIGLAYNKDIFDEAGVAYPDDTWTWDTLKEVSDTIMERTGKYGMMAPLNEQEGFLNLIYQTGGYYLNDDKTKSGFRDPGTIKGLGEWISWNTENTFSPSQAELSELGQFERFFAGTGAMLYMGSWGINNLYINYPDLNWDIAVLPKCPDPVAGDGRASIYNGLSYATGSGNKNLDVVKDVLKFLGTKEAAIIHGENGAAIPAYNGTGDSWINNYEGKNVKAFVEMMDYGVQFPYSKTKNEWYPKMESLILDVYNGTKTLDECTLECQKIVDGYLATEN